MSYIKVKFTIREFIDLHEIEEQIRIDHGEEAVVYFLDYMHTLLKQNTDGPFDVLLKQAKSFAETNIVRKSALGR